MCLTEAHCGTDLGQIRTRAVPAGDGAYAISGTKIFISAGEHDLTENIVHLVLARLPDAPAGVRGISLFLVPKRRLGPDGSAGPANGVRCGSIEHKMGIHGAATCVMHFEEAEGYLIGAPHQGLRCMFTMMNGARLGVGLQGLGLGETAYQSAASYARERRQGRALKGAAEPGAAADPIIVHPDVRRMLLTARALNEGARALAYWIALQLDISRNHAGCHIARGGRRAGPADDADHQGVLHRLRLRGRQPRRAGAWRARLYPRARHGAAGARCADRPDLRGGERHPGARPRRPQAAAAGRALPAGISSTPRSPSSSRTAATRRLPISSARWRRALGQLQAATLAVAQRGLGDPEEAGAAASDYLKMFGLVAVGFMWCRMAKLASEKRNGDAFYESKLKTARFYVKKVLPDTAALYLKIMAGKSTVMAHAAEEF